MPGTQPKAVRHPARGACRARNRCHRLKESWTRPLTEPLGLRAAQPALGRGSRTSSKPGMSVLVSGSQDRAHHRWSRPPGRGMSQYLHHATQAHAEHEHGQRCDERARAGSDPRQEQEPDGHQAGPYDREDTVAACLGDDQPRPSPMSFVRVVQSMNEWDISSRYGRPGAPGHPRRP